MNEWQAITREEVDTNGDGMINLSELVSGVRTAQSRLGGTDERDEEMDPSVAAESDLRVENLYNRWCSVVPDRAHAT